MKPRRRALLLSLCLLISLAGIATWLTFAVQRERHNQALIVTLEQLRAENTVAEARQAALIVQSLLEAGADPNACEHDSETLSIWQQLFALFHRRPGNPAKGDTPLLLAVAPWPQSPGSPEQNAAIDAYRSQIVRRLLAHGADLHGKDRNGMTALMWAALEGQTPVVQILLDHGADVNAKTNGGTTALMKAAESGQTQIVQILLAHGADVNAKDILGDTALMWAALEGQAPVVPSLLAHGGDVNIKDNDGSTALMKAALTGQKDVVRLLKQAGARE